MLYKWEIYKRASVHICMTNKYGKYIFPHGLWDFPDAIPSAAIVTGDLVSFKFCSTLYETSPSWSVLILIIWAQRQQSESAETAHLVQDRRWWGMLAAMCAQRRQDSCEQKQAWAATRGRWYGAGVNLPINGKDIGNGRLNQNKMNSLSIKSCTVVWEMQSKRRTKVRKDRERKSKWSWLTCYLAKQLGSSLKPSEDSKAHKGSDVGSLDLGPLLEKLKQTTSFSLEKLGPTRIWLKEIKQKYISWQPDNLNSIYTVQQNRSHLNSHCRTIDFYLFI